MIVPGTHIELCDPDQFHAAWEAIADLSDEECEKMSQTVKMFSTKNVLTWGIKEVEIDLSYGNNAGGFVYGIGKYHPQYRLNVDAFDTRQEAESNANTQRERAIASLEKKIARLRKLNFS